MLRCSERKTLLPEHISAPDPQVSAADESQPASLTRKTDACEAQVCRYLVKDFGTSQSPKSTRQRDSRYCP
ncbi:MAG: hypothetical protein G8D28_06850, partial [gamma proteobacterium symbiont of Phacoides pectinatus]